MDPKREQKFWRAQERTWTFLSWIYGILLMLILLPIVVGIIVFLVNLFS
jgi:hypothetical protein